MFLMCLDKKIQLFHVISGIARGVGARKPWGRLSKLFAVI